MANRRDIDWEAFGGSILRPAWNRLARARALASRLSKDRLLPGRDEVTMLARTSPRFLRSAWETLTTALDRDQFFESAARRFLPYLVLNPGVRYGPERGPQRGDMVPELLLPAPGDLETMVGFLALDPKDVVTAEQAALEACARMLPWGVPPVRQVAWLTYDESMPARGFASVFDWPASSAISRSPEVGAQVQKAVSDAVYRAHGGYVPQDPPRTRRDVGARRRIGLVAERVARLARGWVLWGELSETEARVPAPTLDSSRAYSGQVTGVRFGALPDALDAALVVWRLGLALLDVRGESAVIGIPRGFRPLTANSWSAVWTAQIHRRGSGWI